MEKKTRVTAIHRLWKYADELWDKYQTLENGSADYVYYKGQLRSISYCLAEIMRPYYTDPLEIAREIMARGKARSEGRTATTFGVGFITLFPEEPTHWFKAEDGKGYTSDPAYAEVVPDGYPQERLEKRRTDAKGGLETSSSILRNGTKTTTTKREFTPDEVEKIKQAIDAGFEMKMLTMAYSCTEADIRSLLA